VLSKFFIQKSAYCCNIKYLFNFGRALKNALKTGRFGSMAKTIGDRIKQLRGRESREAFAEKFSVSKQTIVRYESGQTSPDADFIARLCGLYNVSADWVIHGREDSSVNKVLGHSSTRKTIAEYSFKDLDFNTFLNSFKNEVPKMSSEYFWHIWGEYVNDDEVQRNWLQIEIMKRFPEFIEWLKKQSDPTLSIAAAALKKNNVTHHYGLPGQLDDD